MQSTNTTNQTKPTHLMFLQSIQQSFVKIVSALAFATFIISPVSAFAVENVVGVAVSSPEFSTLVTAVKTAGLVETLSGTGPFTVLAPTNEAFNKLPSGLLEKLVMPENKIALTKILTYHVIAGKNLAVDVIKLDGKSVPTVNGNTITLKVVNGGVVVNDKVNITKTDLPASNGVIHVIDQVLVPSDLDLSTLVSKPTSNTVVSDVKNNMVRTGGVSLSILSLLAMIILGFGLRLSLKSQK